MKSENNLEELGMRFKIGDICDINKSSLKKNHNLDFINYLDTGNITEGRVDEIKKIVLAEEKIPSRAKRIVKENDIIISTVRPNQKHYGIIKNPIENLIVSTGFVVLSPKKEVNADYLYNYLTLPNITEYLQGIAETSTTAYPSITPSVISDLEIELPSLVEQKAIANILSSLDEKIELNNQMNETLEEMAQALFKRWFVDFEFPNKEGQPYKSSGGEMVESELGMIPKGWTYKKIIDLPLSVTDYVANGSFASLKANVTIFETIEYALFLGMIPKGWTYKKIIDLPLSVTDYVANGSFASLKANVTIFETIEYALFVRNTDIKDNFKSSKRYVNEHSYNFLSKTKLYGGEVLISNVGDVGSVYLCPHLDIPMTLGNNMIMINSIGGEDLNLYLYRLFRSREGQGLIQSITSGSVQLKFNKTQFRNLSILIPTKQLLEQYVELQKSIENMKFHNIKENEQLIRYRDTLLPKLMSGEVRVSDFES